MLQGDDERPSQLLGKNEILVVRTVCTTDWKGRPNHHVILIAKVETQEDAVEAMNKDAEKWMAVDIAASEFLEGEDGEHGDNWELERATEILATKTPTEILEMWMELDTGKRWEMKMQDATKVHREFVERNSDDAEFCTTVYHFLTDDFQPIDC